MFILAHIHWRYFKLNDVTNIVLNNFYYKIYTFFLK